MPLSDQFRGDSYCGLYCGACEVLNLYRNSLEQCKPARWEDLPKPLREAIPRGELACCGCKTTLLSPGCRKCLIRICASEKKVEACVLCREFPCKKVRDRQSYISNVLKDVLPHIRVKFRDAESISEKGYENWCREQVQRWKCPRCGTPFTWYQEICTRCGYYLEPLKEHNQ